MTDRLFADCCYGNDWQHVSTQDCPLALHFDRWTDSYRDRWNDVFVGRRGGRRLWSVTSRGPGNVTIQHSCHRILDKALAAAQAVIADRLSA